MQALIITSNQKLQKSVLKEGTEQLQTWDQQNQVAVAQQAVLCRSYAHSKTCANGLEQRLGDCNSICQSYIHTNARIKAMDVGTGSMIKLSF